MKGLVYAVIFSAFLGLFACNSGQPEPVAWVNGLPLTTDELRYWMLLEKAGVYSYFFRIHGIEDSDNFWLQELDGEIPMEKLRAVALEKAKRVKIQQILALEKGIIETANFDEILDRLQEVNIERRKRVENGEPVYGPVQFTERTYFFHEFDEMVLELKRELAREEITEYEKYIDQLLADSDFKIYKKVYNSIRLK
jgi:hypothetical protein